MNIDACYQLGYIIKKHGLKGELNIFLDVDFPAEYTQLESVFVEINEKLVPFFIDHISLNGNKAIVKFDEVDTAEAADELRGQKLYLPLSSLPDLEEGQFYYHEVIGYLMKDANSGDVGKVASILAGPQQDLFVVDAEGKEVLVPVSDGIIKGIDHSKKIVEVELPEGLLDIYLD
ncbi:16S rRNA processing protein RimM [Fulvivirga sp. RKSG066]|uniref:ribosome maturation factor RimM n=1 Tax=Fulvivirga aurantia TaxID=2529383 RepID=UPI0012BB73FC|nr:ribosome maturation factor RimM [Fulvivirga aurantia]MTI19767.1 16S rRNA processing protein RimM [Fulvivirga aurantia]